VPFSPVDGQIFGDAVREIGRFTAEEHDRNGRTRKVEGKYVVVWRKVGNDWLHDPDI
jgi:ketosteroid isomerase-like protein